VNKAMADICYSETLIASDPADPPLPRYGLAFSTRLDHAISLRDASLGRCLPKRLQRRIVRRRFGQLFVRVTKFQ
jgi:hypothetical protein